MLVVPNVMGIFLWAPPLDKWGNSCRGVQFCKVRMFFYLSICFRYFFLLDSFFFRLFVSFSILFSFSRNFCFRSFPFVLFSFFLSFLLSFFFCRPFIFFRTFFLLIVRFPFFLIFFLLNSLAFLHVFCCLSFALSTFL